MQQPVSIVVRAATLDEIFALRHAVLRTGLPITTARFEQDHDRSTYHFGAFDGRLIVGCLSFLQLPVEGQAAYQLRGMATMPHRRCAGIGSRLLEYAESVLDGHLLWCNARVESHDFYLKHGWRIVSDPFEMEGIGFHYRMLKEKGN